MDALPSDVALKRRAEVAINEQIDSLSFAVTNGIASDFADYKAKAGRIQGLRDALAIIEDIVGQMTGKFKEDK